MKGCVQWNSIYGWEDFTSSEDRTQSARSVGQRLTHWATGAPAASGSWTHDSLCEWKTPYPLSQEFCSQKLKVIEVRFIVNGYTFRGSNSSSFFFATLLMGIQLP